MSAIEPLPATTRHLVIDMQRLFAEETEWRTPAIADILPNVLKLSQAHLDRTLFARFMTPANPDAATGRWQVYYRRWASMTGDRLAPGMLDLVAPLAALATPANVVEKVTYSIFGAPGFAARLEAEGVDTLVFSGVETDVCVLASLFDAIDRGYRVVVASDAMTSSSPTSHAAMIEHLFPRLAQQIDVATTDTVLRVWTL
jgi:nicotinamidase-related amidase